MCLPYHSGLYPFVLGVFKSAPHVLCRMSVGWESGRRCTLFDKDHPLKNMKHGRLYLTANYLCYEQSSKQKDPESRFSIAIREISYVTKVGRQG